MLWLRLLLYSIIWSNGKKREIMKGRLGNSWRTTHKKGFTCKNSTETYQLLSPILVRGDLVPVYLLRLSHFWPMSWTGHEPSSDHYLHRGTAYDELLKVLPSHSDTTKTTVFEQRVFADFLPSTTIFRSHIAITTLLLLCILDFWSITGCHAKATHISSWWKPIRSSVCAKTIFPMYNH